MGGVLTRDGGTLGEEAGDLRVKLKFKISFFRKLLIALFDILRDPNVEAGADDSVDHVAQPGPANPIQVSLMRPVGFDLLVSQGTLANIFDCQVLIEWNVDDLDVITVDGYTIVD
jgi:hypothetical protein